MISTELFQFLCYQSNLTFADLEIMTIGNCIDYIQEYIEQHKPEKQKQIRKRKATQADFDSF